LRELFAANFLFTKKLALARALDLALGDRTRSQARETVREETDRLLAETPDDLYCEAIRDRQLVEIEVLLDHFVRLLGAEGSDHGTLVRHAYRTREDYAAFLGLLRSAEQDVSRASVEALGPRADASLAERMDSAAARIREAEMDRIFSHA
jgi:hypothetical protein